MPFTILDAPDGKLSVYEVIYGFEQNSMARQCHLNRHVAGEPYPGRVVGPMWVSRTRLFKTELAAVANGRKILQDRIQALQGSLTEVRLHEVQLRGLEPPQVSAWERLVSDEEDPDEIPLPSVHGLGDIQPPWDGSVPVDDPMQVLVNAFPSDAEDE
jgi:hypothetical protein